MKAYYHLQVGILCGVCGYVCMNESPVYERAEHPIGPLPQSTWWICPNYACPQYSLLFEVPAMEAAVIKDWKKEQEVK